MKILQVVTQMEAGGAQKVAILLANSLHDRGYDSEVCFLYLKRPTYLNTPNTRVLINHPPLALSNYIDITFKLWRLLSSYQPDVLITHTYYASILGQLIAYFCGVRLRIAVQHNPLQTYPKIANFLDMVMGSMFFYSANVAVSQAVVDSAKAYSPFYKNKICKIYNGVPLPQSRVRSSKDIRSRWGVPQDAPLLINVGRLAKQKNQTILIEVLGSLSYVHLLLVGDGELRETLNQKVREFNLESRVHFCGELSSSEVLALLSVADIFVLPSLYEAMPMALIEAMSMGLPIVASDIPALREVLDSNGILVPAEDLEAVTKAVQQILGSPELSNQLRQRALNRSRTFSIEKMVDSYEALFS